MWCSTMKVATTSRLLLFSTGACHLCEQAKALVQSLPCEDWCLEEVDISESDELFERYGLLIPVLRLEQTGQELNWPFSREEVGALLAPA